MFTHLEASKVFCQAASCLWECLQGRSRENCGKAAGGNEWGFWDAKERDRGNKSQHGSVLAYEVVNYTDIYARHNQLRGRIYRSLPFPDYQRKIQARSWLEDGVQGTEKGHSMREHDFSRSKCLQGRASQVQRFYLPDT